MAAKMPTISTPIVDLDNALTAIEQAMHYFENDCFRNGRDPVNWNETGMELRNIYEHYVGVLDDETQVVRDELQAILAAGASA